MPDVGDDEIVTWWGLVIEGYQATQDRLLAAIADDPGLTPGPFDILLRLLRSPGHRLPMTRLAKEAALSSGGFTKVADRMTEAGLIRREPSETDRRVTHVVLTDHGREMAQRAREVTSKVLRERVLEPLGERRATELAESMRALRAINGSVG
nr:MarR family transcriptional regulator [Kibdelosporangium sp. MJ126-NF4]CEL14323.1 regulatory protein, MarR [Kibdelosporangium sp. MJ126-NF4]CTQ88690.1 regulatory protein, MarR [Kibdelosporangium sp. MJ126-NF4]